MITASIVSKITGLYHVVTSSPSQLANDLWHAIEQGISDAVMAALRSLLVFLMHAISAAMTTTTPTFAGNKYNNFAQPAIFSPVWHTMVIVGIIVAMFIMIVGAVSAILRGETGLLGKQFLYGGLAVLLMASPIVPIFVEFLFEVINILTRFIMTSAYDTANTSLHAATGKEIAVLSAFLAASGETGGVVVPGILYFIVGVLAALASVIVWFELLAREAVAYLIMGLFPLALAGMFYKGTSKWVRRAVEGVIAVAMSQIIIAILVAFATSSLLNAGSAVSITSFALFAMFMFLATLGLPIALRVVPVALEMGDAMHHASSLAGSVRGQVAQKTYHPVKRKVLGSAGSSARRGSFGSPPGSSLGSSIAGGKGNTEDGTDSGSPAGSPSPHPTRPSMTETIAMIGDIAAAQNTPKRSPTLTKTQKK